jgi:hypothetical protein
MRALTRAWNEDRNSRQSKADWQFSTEDARIKLKKLYPKIRDVRCAGLIIMSGFEHGFSPGKERR